MVRFHCQTMVVRNYPVLSAALNGAIGVGVRVQQKGSGHPCKQVSSHLIHVCLKCASFNVKFRHRDTVVHKVQRNLYRILDLNMDIIFVFIGCVYECLQLGLREAEWNPARKSQEVPPGAENPDRQGQHVTAAALTGKQDINTVRATQSSTAT